MKRIQFCITPDGVQLALREWAAGRRWSRPATDDHLEFDFESPIWRHLYLSSRATAR